MEPLIRELTDPRNQGVPARIHEIQRQLQLLQREPAAWQGGLVLLENPDSTVRFYGALTLTIKINADWKNDKIAKNAEHRQSLLQALVTAYVRLSLAEDENFVLQKLASTLTLLYQKLGSQWPKPIQHVLTSIISGQYVQPKDLPSMRDLIPTLDRISAKQIASVMRLMITLAEDINSRASGSITQKDLANDSGDMLEIIGFLLVSHCQRFVGPGIDAKIRQSNRIEVESQLLASLALEALPLWSGLMKLQEATASNAEMIAANEQAILCIRATIQMLATDRLGHPALQALINIQTLTPRLIAKAEPTFIERLSSSVIAQKWGTALVRGDFSPEAMAFAELVEAIMLHVDTTSPDYMLSGRYSGVLQLVLSLLRCDGVAGVEDQVCATMIEAANNVVEGFTDWDPEPAAEQALQQFTQEACAACLDKTKYPLEEMNYATRTWDKDDLAMFQEFRFDVQDFMQSAFGVLGRPLVEAIVTSAQQEPSDIGWVGFEASLQCLVAFADTMASDEGTYDQLVGQVFGTYHFQQVLRGGKVPDMARRTVIRFISEMPSYFKRHPDLMQVLSFLFSSLHVSSSATIASRAIYDFCEMERSSFTGALPDFLAALNTIQDLRGMDRHRIYGAVAAIVQALPTEVDKLQPLEQIFDTLRSDSEQLGVGQQDDEAFIRQNTELLQTLAAIGRGLREPEQFVRKATSEDASFWITGPGSNVQQKMLTIYQRIMHRAGQNANSEFVEAACDFVRSGFTENHPSPLKFDSATSTELVTSNITVDSPNIDAAMSSASSLIAAAAKEDFKPHFQRLLHAILAGIEQLLGAEDRITKVRDSSYPSASLDFLARLFPRWGQTLLELPEAQQAFSLCLELGLLVITEPDTLPRRSAAQLFGAFVHLGKPGKLNSDVAKLNMETIAKEYHPRLIASLLRLIGGECARSELGTLSDQIRRYVSFQAMLFKNISREAIKEESAVLTERALQATTMEQRQRVVAQIDNLRGTEKTNDVVKEFWLACRGNEFTYVT